MPNVRGKTINPDHDVNYLGAIKGVADGALTAGDAVYISGSNTGGSRFSFAKADAGTGAQGALLFAAHGANDGDQVIVRGWLVRADVDTDGAAVGDPVYLSATAGGWSLTVPANGGEVVGQVLEVDATAGSVLLYPERKRSGLQREPVQAIDMADAAVALVVKGTAGAGEVLIYSNTLFVDANSGATEDLTLPPEADFVGLLYVFNTGGESIVVKNDGGSTIKTVPTAKSAVFACNGTAWLGLLSA